MAHADSASAFSIVCALSIGNTATAAWLGATLRRERVGSRKRSLLLFGASALLGALAGARTAAARGATTPIGAGGGAPLELSVAGFASAGLTWAALPAAAFALALFARRYLLPEVERALATRPNKAKLHRGVLRLVLACGSFEAFSIGLNQAWVATWAFDGFSGRGYLALGSLTAGAYAAWCGARVLGRTGMLGRLSLLDSAAASLLCGGLALVAARGGVPAPLILHSAAGIAGIAWEKIGRIPRRAPALLDEAQACKERALQGALIQGDP